MEKTYLITGANSDIGAEVCRMALQSGNRVIALYHVNRSRLDGLSEYGDALTPVVSDFTSGCGVEGFISDNKHILKGVDSFVSLAAMRDKVQFGEITAGDLMDHFSANVIPHVLLMQFLGPYMVDRGWGRILVGSSIGVRFGGGDDSYCYSLSKYAGELIPKIAKKWSASNVLTNIVRIGITDTKAFRSIGTDRVLSRSNLVPMQRLAQPKEIADSIYWLASEQNTYITGQTIAVSGGE